MGPHYADRGPFSSLKNLTSLRGDVFLREFIALTVVFLGAMALPLGDWGFPICIFRHITNLPCPGCGMSRAFVAVGHGEIIRAIQFNLFILVLFPVAAWHWNRLFWYLLFGLDGPTLIPQRRFKAISIVLLVSIMVFWAVRLAVHWQEFEWFGLIRGWL